MRVTFDEVFVKRTRTGKCATCGKRRSRTRKFYQTINPYNRDAAGLPKSPQQISFEVQREASEWMKAPLVCASCEASPVTRRQARPKAVRAWVIVNADDKIVVDEFDGTPHLFAGRAHASNNRASEDEHVIRVEIRPLPPRTKKHRSNKK